MQSKQDKKNTYKQTKTKTFGDYIHFIEKHRGVNAAKVFSVDVVNMMKQMGIQDPLSLPVNEAESILNNIYQAADSIKAMMPTQLPLSSPAWDKELVNDI